MRACKCRSFWDQLLTVHIFNIFLRPNAQHEHQLSITFPITFPLLSPSFLSHFFEDVGHGSMGVWTISRRTSFVTLVLILFKGRHVASLGAQYMDRAEWSIPVWHELKTWHVSALDVTNNLTNWVIELNKIEMKCSNFRKWFFFIIPCFVILYIFGVNVWIR